MKKVIIFIILIILLTFFSRSESSFSLNGYFKSFFIVFEMPDYQSQGGVIKKPAMGAVNNRIRLKLSLKPSDWFSFHTSYNFSPRIQDPSLFSDNIFFANIDPLSYRFDDFESKIYPKSSEEIGSFGLFHNLDRFYITVKSGFADIIVGRQVIAWGSARIINPTDVIAPFAFNELDTEERRGVDALRVRIPLGSMDELDMGFIAGKDFTLKQSAFFMRGKIYFLQTDLSLIFLGFRQNLLIGMDITRSIGGAGFWFEAGYVIVDFFNKKKPEDIRNYFRLSTGLDYNFKGGIYGFFEYHFNSAGYNDPKNYLKLLTSAAFLDGSVYLMGKHYINLGVTFQASPLIPITSLAIFNLSDMSLTLSPMVEYNIAENIYISAGAYIGIGKGPEMTAAPGSFSPVLLNSEFGAYPDMIFTSFRIYF